MDKIVANLLNGKKPPKEYLQGELSNSLMVALKAKIAEGVAPSKCANAMCSSAAAGNAAVVSMLAAQPVTIFNAAYKFSEPLRRSCRAFLKATDIIQKKQFAECAILIAAANGNLDETDPYYSNPMSAAEMLTADGSEESLKLLEELRNASSNVSSVASGKKRKSKVKEEGAAPVVPTSTTTASNNKRVKKSK
jgi:hypothetical protein